MPPSCMANITRFSMPRHNIETMRNLPRIPMFSMVGSLKRDELKSEILSALISRWGLLLDKRALMEALGIRSRYLLAKSLDQGALPLPRLRIPGQRGTVVRAHDLAEWMATQGVEPSSVHESKEVVAERGP